MRVSGFYLTPIACSDVSRPDRLSSAEISSVVQAAGLQGNSNVPMIYNSDQNPQLFVKIDMLFYLLTSRKLGRSVALFCLRTS